MDYLMNGLIIVIKKIYFDPFIKNLTLISFYLMTVISLGRLKYPSCISIFILFYYIQCFHSQIVHFFELSGTFLDHLEK